MQAQKGEVIGGRYCLEHVIGEGGMGSVWRARDETLERPVALKLLDLERTSKRASTLESFLREAKLCAAVRHRNVVQILDFGTHRDAMPYMAMEYLEGETLGDVFYFGGQLAFDRIVQVVTGILEGLSSVHDAGIVHRDLKPENVFLVHDRTGEYPKLLDFGISKSLDPRGDAESPVNTRGDRVVGTPAYMAPEQARGLKDVDARADIYAVGVILYEALSGVVPFYSENPGDLLVKIVTQEATPLIELVPDVGQSMSDLVAMAMHKDRSKRLPDATAMREALLDVAQPMLAGGASVALSARERPPSWRQTSDTYSRSVRVSGARPAVGVKLTGSPVRGSIPSARSWWVGGLVGVVVAAIIVASALLWLRGGDEPAAEPKFIVVESTNAPAQVPAPSPAVAAAEPAAPGPAAPGPAAQPGSDRPPARAQKAASAKAPRPRAAPLSREARLARRFSKQKAKVARCFVEHPSDGKATEKLSLRFEVNAQGRVQRVEVLPPSLADTELGRCVKRSGATMTFGPQDSTVSFVVPVTARRSRS